MPSSTMTSAATAFRIGTIPEFSVDAFVRDLEAVVDALGFDQFTLIGSSKGGPTAIAYAALHPERVSHLVLYGTLAQGWRVRGNAAEIERNEAIITLTRQGWAQDNPAFRQILTSLFVPDATLEEMDWFNDPAADIGLGRECGPAAAVGSETSMSSTFSRVLRRRRSSCIAATTLPCHWNKVGSSPAGFPAPDLFRSRAATMSCCLAIPPGRFLSARCASFFVRAHR